METSEKNADNISVDEFAEMVRAFREARDFYENGPDCRDKDGGCTLCDRYDICDRTVL